ncbi:MAG: hypothetical protein H0T89_31675 [Deltaproteobacteria bacterium]|nr:hypothetical protein [Deltaproteobacteria bacterium]MDQ3295593.1 hypothetical protein [Myxococcota bacterium]
MAKRSPILGYNHNVRYRGLVFHVQTEDSGMASPHLFTHLFHGGVIISTRKLVYDSGAAEESIKSLMQAQHKAVMKDLKKGTFDDKIDVYLAGTEGLLPRGVKDEEAGAVEAVAAPVVKPPVVAEVAAAAPEPASSRAPTVADDNHEELENAAQKPRTQTAERGSAPSAVRTNLPPAPTADEPETLSDQVAAAVAAGHATVPTRLPRQFDGPPGIEIELELDDADDELHRARRGRDTDIAPEVFGGRPLVELESSDGVPGGGRSASGRVPGQSVPPLPAAPSGPTRAPSAVGAASLPPARPIVRPPSRQAMSPPQVVSRPLSNDQGRPVTETDAVEVYAPAPPSADAPPGMVDRSSQYAQHKRLSTKMPALDPREAPREAPRDQRTGAYPIPPGLGRPGRISTGVSGGVPKPIGRDPSSRGVLANSAPAEKSSGNVQRELSPEGQPRTSTPARSGTSANPNSGRVVSANTSGVVMTRPAVIVGAPAKPPPLPRVRKAREDEGRGFGQGLISEKSLDEVILAYLSEDADDK